MGCRKTYTNTQKLYSPSSVTHAEQKIDTTSFNITTIIQFCNVHVCIYLAVKINLNPNHRHNVKCTTSNVALDSNTRTGEPI